MLESKLLPCPFCGREGRFAREVWKGTTLALTLPENQVGCVFCNIWMTDKMWNTRSNKSKANCCQWCGLPIMVQGD